MIHKTCLALVILLCVGAVHAAPEPPRTVLFDSGGFADAAMYPEGALRAGELGNARWRPSPVAPVTEILTLSDEADKRVLRRHQTGQQAANVDYLDFPPATAAELTVSFRARVSTADSRTMDMFLMRPGATSTSAQASVLIWGHEPGYLSYFDGRYRRLAQIGTEWREYDIVHNLAANRFALRINGETVGQDLRWRNTFPADAAFGRLRIGGIRGEAGAYADIADLRITRGPTPPAIEVLAPLADGGIVTPAGGLRFQVHGAGPAEPGSVSVTLNGEAANGRLAFEAAPGGQVVSVPDLPPMESFRAVIAAENDQGRTEQSLTFHTYENEVDGFRGIWFTLGQLAGEYGDKYSGGSAFAWSHTLTPMALYAPEVDKTFFVYSGVPAEDSRYLLIMASYYDHATGLLRRPVIVRDQRGVDDPHDNASIALDEDGRLWVFVAGRGRSRPGQIFRSLEPYAIDGFEKLASGEQTYSQVWTIPGRGLFHLLTKYTDGRELYWETITDGARRSEQRKLAGFGGHYQVSRAHGGKVGTAFNYHAGRSVDRRTNLYYLETNDFGQTWTTAAGAPVDTPLNSVHNPALVTDYESKGRLVYVLQTLFDEDGHPVVLFVTSGGFQPGPDNDPRRWKVARWTGSEWITHTITESGHNYDVGSLYLHPDRWTLIAPALQGPQPYHTGGEVGLWVSRDKGATWELERNITQGSRLNHSYLRRPHNPKDPFYALWADGDSSAFSISRLFFTNATGDALFMMPYAMDGKYAEPVPIDSSTPPAP